MQFIAFKVYVSKVLKIKIPNIHQWKYIFSTFIKLRDKKQLCL